MKICKLLVLLPLTMALLHAVAASAVETGAGEVPDVSGPWQGPEWGAIILREIAPRTYEGKFTEVATPGPGTLRVTWSADKKAYEGEWREGTDQRGHVTFTLAEDEHDVIKGDWTIEEPKGVVDPPFGKLRWVKGSNLQLYGFHITDEVLDILADQTLDTLLLAALNFTDEGLPKLARVKSCRHLQLRSQRLIGPGLAGLKNVKGLEILELPGGFSEDMLAYVGDIPELRELTLHGIRLTSDGLTPIAKLTDLRRLNLNGCPITDGGLAHLSPLKNLESLDLSHTKIHDNGLERLKPFSHLKELKLARNNDAQSTITNAGMEHLAALTSLETLDLTGTAIDDRGIELLRPLQRLKKLDLARTSISDKALTTLAEFPEIESLSLSLSAKQDLLPPLQALKKLKNLTFLATPAAWEEIQKLNDALPNCSINLQSG